MFFLIVQPIHILKIHILYWFETIWDSQVRVGCTSCSCVCCFDIVGHFKLHNLTYSTKSAKTCTITEAIVCDKCSTCFVDVRYTGEKRTTQMTEEQKNNKKDRIKDYATNNTKKHNQ